MTLTTRNLVISAQLSSIAARLDAILATMKDDIATMKDDVAAIKTQMIKDGSYCEEIKNRIIMHTSFNPDDLDPEVIENHQKFERVDYQSQSPKDQEIEGDEDDDFIPNVNSPKDNGPIQITLHHSTKGAEVLDLDHVRKDPQVVGKKTVPKLPKEAASRRDGSGDVKDNHHGPPNVVARLDLQPQSGWAKLLVYEACQPIIEWLIAWHNYWIIDLRTSRFTRREVMIRTKLDGSKLILSIKCTIISLHN
ncbi:hypothetical protein HanHA89_Chr13g0531381 [Helianthus annuus]|nr:hypothetical protein HanHA89_Chr13g0531381 [Helianthus annuus]